MKFIRNRAVAIIIALAVICSSTAFFGKQGIEDLYEDKVESVYSLSLDSKVRELANCANGVSQVLLGYSGYETLSAELRAARTAYFEAGTASSKIEAADTLTACLESARTAAATGDFSNADKEKLSSYISTYDARLSEYKTSFVAYQSSVREYLKVTESLPGMFFEMIADVPDMLAV